MRRIAAIAAAALCVANVCNAQARPISDTPLVDQHGAKFTLRELRGKPTLVTFIATRCTDVCPIADSVFARIAHEHLDVNLVIITLDPQYDSPFVMSRYARNLQASSARWRFASGKASDIYALVDGFGVTRIATDVHSTSVYILDEAGRLAKTLPLSTTIHAQVRSWLATRSESISQRHGKGA